jgi:hypothetical protein
VAGFECIYDETPFPQKNDWVEAIGTVTSGKDANGPYVFLKLSQLKVLDERGEEYVSN